MTFREKVQAMTAKEIIMAMVDGLRNPVVEIDMTTFGSLFSDDRDGEIACFGCAATNFILTQSDKTLDDFIEYDGICHEMFGTDMAIFMDHFEMAIDDLRSGNLDDYNELAEILDLAIIKFDSSNLSLPTINNGFTEKDLQAYVDLANAQ